jgi:hypothetical protein
MEIAPVIALVGDRVYARRRTPPETWKPADGPCIVFSRRGGNWHDEENSAVSISYQFKVYGGDVHQHKQELGAVQLFRALYDGLLFSHCRPIMGIQCEGMPADLEEPATGWPFTLAFFRVQYRQER